MSLIRVLSLAVRNILRTVMNIAAPDRPEEDAGDQRAGCFRRSIVRLARRVFVKPCVGSSSGSVRQRREVDGDGE
jgi:hypothetical protein